LGRTQRLSTIAALTALFLIVALFLTRTALPAAQRLSHGFMAYYVGAQTLREGAPATQLYDDPWFSGRVMQMSHGRVTDIYLANPPTLAVAWLPFAYLSVETARGVWIGFSVLCLALSFWLIANELGCSRQPWALLAMSALFTLPAPVREQFFLGQMYACVLLLHVLGWSAYIHRRDATAGLALGLAMALKISGWPIGLLLLAQRRWSGVATAIATGAAAVLLTLPWVGFAAWHTLLAQEIPHIMHWGAATLTAYQDTTGLWQHLFRYDATYNPMPLIDAPRLATALTLATTLGACWALIARERPAVTAFAAAVALSELLSPAAEQYHYIVLLLPLTVLWDAAWRSRNRALGFSALAATLLIACPMDYQATHPAWTLIQSYPRLIGGWIAFAALLHADRAAESYTRSASLPMARASGA
jgi:glycosyl transferase family 87